MLSNGRNCRYTSGGAQGASDELASYIPLDREVVNQDEHDSARREAWAHDGVMSCYSQFGAVYGDWVEWENVWGLGNGQTDQIRATWHSTNNR